MNLSLEVNSMEQVTAAVNDELVQSLDYKLQSSNVNYVQSRADVVYYPSSLSVFTPTTSRVCRIPLTSGQSFVDGESVKLGFTVRNNSDTATLQLASPDPSCLIDRIEVFANGTRIEDISYYNRCSYMYGLLKNEEWWLNRHIQGFLADGGGHAAPIPASGSRTVLMSPHLIGILNCGKMLPPELNLVLQITFCDPTDGARNVSGSQDYTIENVKLYASQVTLDSALRESFQRIMTSGRSLVFSFPTIHTQLSSIPAGSTSYNIVVSRAFTKMLGAFVTFNKTTEDHVDNFEYPGANANRNLKGQLQLGALQYPRTANESIAEWHDFLEILAGTYDSKLRNMRIRDNLFGNTQFVAAFPVERVPKHPLSGISTRSGDLCRFSFSNMEADRADQCFVHMLSYQLCTLSSAGVSSLD